MKRNYKNVVIFSNGSIGDFLMATLFLVSIRKILPSAKFTIITPRNEKMLRELLSAYPYIKVVEINRKNFLKLVPYLLTFFLSKTLIFNSVSFGKVSCGVKALSRFLSMISGGKSLGFSEQTAANKKPVSFDYDESVYENLTKLLGTQQIKIPPDVPMYNFIKDKNTVKKYGLEGLGYVVIHPCAFSYSRSLPTERWARIFEYISNNFPNFKIVVTGSKNDIPFIKEIFKENNPRIPVVNLAGAISMLELADIIDNAAGYMGVDTGISHLAGVIQKQSLIIGNLSNPSWLPSYNKKAVILTNSENCTCDGRKGGNCFYVINGKKYHRCMLDVSEKEICEKINTMLAK